MPGCSVDIIGKHDTSWLNSIENIFVAHAHKNLFFHSPVLVLRGLVLKITHKVYNCLLSWHLVYM